MRALAILTGLIMLCVLCWFFASILSPDAVGMAVGMLFGVLAGIPTALLMMASGRQRVREEDDNDTPARAAPVVILYPPAQQTSPSTFGWPERISAEDEHLYTYSLSAYGDTPRRVALPVNDEAERVRRLAKRGKLSKMPADFEGETPAGYRRIVRSTDDGHFEREEW